MFKMPSIEFEYNSYFYTFNVNIYIKLKYYIKIYVKEILNIIIEYFLRNSISFTFLFKTMFIFLPILCLRTLFLINLAKYK